MTTNLTPRKCIGSKSPLRAILRGLRTDLQKYNCMALLHLAPESQSRAFASESVFSAWIFV